MIKNKSKLKACSLESCYQEFWMIKHTTKFIRHNTTFKKFQYFHMSRCFHVPWCTSLFLKFGLLIEIFLKLTVNFYFWNILKFGHNLINTFWYFSLIWKFCVAKSWIQKWSVELQTFHSSFLCSIFSTDFWQGLLFFLKAVVSLNQQKCKKKPFWSPKKNCCLYLG